MTPAMNHALRDMPSAGDSVQVVADSPLLRSIDRSSLDGLGPELEWIDLHEHEGLSLDGSRGDALYFVASGRLEITHASAEQGAAAGDDVQVLAVIIAGDVISEMRALTGSKELAAVRGVTAARLVRLAKEGFDRYLATHPDVSEISQGETVGEMGVFTEEIQTTSVVATRDSVLLEFSRDNFHELATRYPKLNEWLARLLSIRLRGVVQQTPPEHSNTNILLVPANDGAPVEDFARRSSGRSHFVRRGHLRAESDGSGGGGPSSGKVQTCQVPEDSHPASSGRDARTSGHHALAERTPRRPEFSYTSRPPGRP